MAFKMNLRLWILLILIVSSVIAINPLGYFENGVVVRTVEKESTAALAGLQPEEIIKEINGQKILTLEEYTAATSKLFLNVKIRSSKADAEIGSRPAVGSSRKRISGSTANARASPALFTIPPPSASIRPCSLRFPKQNG